MPARRSRVPIPACSISAESTEWAHRDHPLGGPLSRREAVPTYCALHLSVHRPPHGSGPAPVWACLVVPVRGHQAESPVHGQRRAGDVRRPRRFQEDDHGGDPGDVSGTAERVAGRSWWWASDSSIRSSRSRSPRRHGVDDDAVVAELECEDLGEHAETGLGRAVCRCWCTSTTSMRCRDGTPRITRGLCSAAGPTSRWRRIPTVSGARMRRRPRPTCRCCPTRCQMRRSTTSKPWASRAPGACSAESCG